MGGRETERGRKRDYLQKKKKKKKRRRRIRIRGGEVRSAAQAEAAGSLAWPQAAGQGSPLGYRGWREIEREKEKDKKKREGVYCR